VVHGSNVSCRTALSSGGRTLVTAGGGLVRVWNVETGECQRQWGLGDDPLQQIELSGDATRLVTTQLHRAVVWNVLSGTEIYRIEPALKDVAAARVEPGGRVLLTFDADNRARFWRTNGATTGLGVGQGSSWAMLRNAEFSRDGRLLCTGGDGGSARVWEVESGKERFALPKRVFRAQFSPDGWRLATVGGRTWRGSGMSRAGPNCSGSAREWNITVPRCVSVRTVAT